MSALVAHEYQTYLVTRGQMRWLLGVIKRYGAVLLLLLSLAGSVFAFCDGIDAVFRDGLFNAWRHIPLRAVVAGVAFQLVLTAFQFAKRDEWRSAQYLIPLTCDVGLSYLGYQAWLVPLFAGGAAHLGLPSWTSYIAAIGAVFLLAIWPERLLVRPR